MTRWKAAGAAPRGVDEQLWRRFRTAQDTFFGAKQTVNAAQDVEFRANAEAKTALLDEAEAQILPVTDLGKARVAYRELLERWSAIGKVPRDSMRPLDARLHAIESAVNEAEEHSWRRTNPEARARAEDTAAKLEAQIATLEEQATKAVRPRRRAGRPAGARLGGDVPRVARAGAAGGQRLLRAELAALVSRARRSPGCGAPVPPSPLSSASAPDGGKRPTHPDGGPAPGSLARPACSPASGGQAAWSSWARTDADQVLRRRRPGRSGEGQHDVVVRQQAEEQLRRADLAVVVEGRGPDRLGQGRLRPGGERQVALREAAPPAYGPGFVERARAERLLRPPADLVDVDAQRRERLVVGSVASRETSATAAASIPYRARTTAGAPSVSRRTPTSRCVTPMVGEPWSGPPPAP